MNEILKTIIGQKKLEVTLLKKRRGDFNGRQSPKRDFTGCFKNREQLAIIAEVKKASPSKGVIREDFDPVGIAQSYHKGGASAVSVLTDEKFFQGHEDFLVAVRERVSLPVLRKDFIIDILQVEHTASIGSDAILLIAAALDDAQIKDLYQSALELELDPLIEIHSLNELDRVMKLNPALIGINNRDLNTFKTDIAVTTELVKRIPSEIAVISESGIHSKEQTLELFAAGIAGILVGESLMRSDDPGCLISELLCSKENL